MQWSVFVVTAVVNTNPDPPKRSAGKLLFFLWFRMVQSK